MATDASGHRVVTRADVMVQLAQDAATAEAVSALEAQGIRAILLKGAAIAARLYDNPAERSYGDGDLLVDPARYADAVDVMARLGYADPLATWSGLSRPTPAPGIGVIDDRPPPPAALLAGFAADRGRALGVGTRLMTVGGREVEVLGDPALALVVAAHFVQHGTAASRWKTCERALARFDRDVWRRAARAPGLAMDEVFAAGLRGCLTAGRWRASSACRREPQPRSTA